MSLPVFFFKFVLPIQDPLRVHVHFGMGFSVSVKNVTWILVGLALNL
jgi:hypothetical protein